MDKKTNFSGWNKGFEYLWIDSIKIRIYHSFRNHKEHN